MIKYNELRIGNIFWEGYGGYAKVVGLRGKGNTPPYDALYVHNSRQLEDAAGAISFEDMYPVKLTDDIFKDSGFKTHYDKSGSIHWTIAYNRLGEDGKVAELLFNYNDIMQEYVVIAISHNTDSAVGLNAIKNVHQLQNIVFAITGEEIEIKIVK